MEPRITPRRLSSAILLNAFIMPGSGHILAGMARRGYAIASLTILFAILPLLRYMLSVMEAMRRPSTSLEGMARSFTALDTAWQHDRRFIFFCFAAVAILWLYGIVDLWLRKKKLETTQGDPQSKEHP